jgi:peptidoglycan/LPS O-acetylase OafA/YrhL
MSGGAGERRFDGLDGLRAIAVLAVVVSHSFDEVRDGWAAYGSFGVHLFFVLSGFLITGILLDARRDASTSGAPIAGVFRAFYERRALRIMPLYFATIAVGTIIGVQGMREHLGWNLLYVSNWRIALDGHWGSVTHVWSLAVEEQFYLLWPLVVLLAPRRLLPWAIGSMISVAIVTRVALTAWTDAWADGIVIITPAVLDALGAGALLAFLWRFSPRVDRIVTYIGVLGVSVLVCEHLGPRLLPSLPDPSPVTWIGWSLVFVWVVHHVARGLPGRAGAAMRWRPLAYIGIISYGIYMFHLFVVPVAEIAERHIGVDLPIPALGWGRLVVVAVVSIAAAAASWTFFERPINTRKRHFPYIARETAGSESSLPAVVAPPTRLSS